MLSNDSFKIVELAEMLDKADEDTASGTMKTVDKVVNTWRRGDQHHLITQILRVLKDGVLLLDEAFQVTIVNPAYARYSGMQPEQIIGKKPPFYKEICSTEAGVRSFWEAIEKDGAWEGEISGFNGNEKAFSQTVAVTKTVSKTGKTKGYVVVVNDVTAQRIEEERLRQQANFDSLTNLPSRPMFMEHLGEELLKAKTDGTSLALMFIDLDGFKLINDTLGHDIGDMLIQEAAFRIIGSLGNDDMPARLGGDEFTIVVPNVKDPEKLALLASKIMESFADPFNLQGNETFVSASIGIALYPDHGSKINDLVRNAEMAMYRAKEEGKAKYNFFSSELDNQVSESLLLKTNIKTGLINNEFQLHYQPKLEIASGLVTGVEALMRWISPEHGFIPPDRFIPIMEETGIVVEVGYWALETACKQHRDWLDAGIPPTRIAVNLSARQLQEPDFTTRVEEILNNSGIDPSGLEIEITESMLMSDASSAIVALKGLHDMGLHVAMDDFGTGYSSLSYLKKFPIDTIKIDRSFVNDIATDTDDAEIIKTIITMGQTLNRKIVAEGVETQEQLDILSDYWCDEIQGYFFARPLPAEEATAFLKEHNSKIQN